MKKRIVALLLALCMLAALCACGGGATEAVSSAPAETEVSTSEAEAPDAPAEQTPEAAPAEEAPSAVEEAPEEAEPVYEKVEVPLPISEDGDVVSMYLLLPPFITAMVDRPNDLTVLGELERRTGLRFDITPGNYIDGSTDVNLLIAGGTYPDLINHADLYSNGIDAAVNEEIVIDLKDYILNDMPNLLASLKAYDVDVIKQMTTDSGYIAYFPQIHKEPYVDNFVTVVRKDMMEEQGLEIPKTYDQFHDMLVALNGAYGMQYGMNPAGYDEALLTGFNVNPNGNGIGMRVVDGEVQYSSVQEETYAYLQMISQWYSEGLIFNDFISYESFMQANMMTAGNTLFACGGCNAQTINEALVNGIDLVPIPYPTRNVGDEIKIGGSGEVVRSAAWSVSTQCSDEALENILQLVDYIFSEEGTLLFNYGVEGEAFVFGENGEPQWTDLIMTYDGGTTTACMIYATATPAEYIPGIYDDAKFNYSYTDAMLEAQDIINNSSTGEYDYPIGADNRISSEDLLTAAALNNDLSTYVSETVLAWIHGQSVLNDDTWNAYVDTCYSMGLQEIVDIYQGGYDEFMAE